MYHQYHTVHVYFILFLYDRLSSYILNRTESNKIYYNHFTCVLIIFYNKVNPKIDYLFIIFLFYFSSLDFVCVIFKILIQFYNYKQSFFFHFIKIYFVVMIMRIIFIITIYYWDILYSNWWSRFCDWDAISPNFRNMFDLNRIRHIMEYLFNAFLLTTLNYKKINSLN